MDLTYTTIIHSIRKKLGLSNNEYMFCDMVYHLSNNPRYKTCKMSKENLGDKIGITEAGIFKMINRMIGLDLIIRSEEGLNTTKRWYDEVICKDSETLNSVVPTLNSVVPKAKLSLYNNNNSNKNKLDACGVEEIQIVSINDEDIPLKKKKDVAVTREHSERMALIGFFKRESERVHHYCPVIQVPTALKRLKELYRFSNYEEIHGLIDWYINVSDMYEKLGSDILKCCCVSSYNSYKDHERKKGI
jgi:hypothetical protein